jgi:hypothetical protein
MYLDPTDGGVEEVTGAKVSPRAGAGEGNGSEDVLTSQGIEEVFEDH